MELATFFALIACLLGAALVYVFLAVRHHGENQVIIDKLNAAEAATAAVEKKLLGYTKYAEHLEVCKKTVAEQLKPPIAKVTRDYVHVEKIAKDHFELKSDATVIVRYTVDFAFGMDLSAGALDVIDAANGVGLKMSRPSLLGDPVVKPQSHQIICETDVSDSPAMLAEVHGKFALLAKRYGAAISSEEALRAMCKLKVQEGLRDALARQNGVRQVPAIFADYK
jgi:hypothetical protein